MGPCHPRAPPFVCRVSPPPQLQHQPRTPQGRCPQAGKGQSPGLDGACSSQGPDPAQTRPIVLGGTECCGGGPVPVVHPVQGRVLSSGGPILPPEGAGTLPIVGWGAQHQGLILPQGTRTTPRARWGAPRVPSCSTRPVEIQQHPVCGGAQHHGLILPTRVPIELGPRPVRDWSGPHPALPCPSVQDGVLSTGGGPHPALPSPPHPGHTPHRGTHSASLNRGHAQCRRRAQHRGVCPARFNGSHTQCRTAARYREGGPDPASSSRCHAQYGLRAQHRGPILPGLTGATPGTGSGLSPGDPSCSV